MVRPPSTLAIPLSCRPATVESAEEFLSVVAGQPALLLAAGVGVDIT